MKRTLLSVLIGIGFGLTGIAQTPTWSENIAPILYANCTKCHHNGGLAPSSLIEYSDAFARKSSISYHVQNKIMPPWPGDPSYRHYADERVLKQSDIDAIVNWVNNGAPEGVVSKAPPKPKYTNDSKIGTHDLKITIPTYTSTAKTGDIYRCFSVPTKLAANQFISAVEILPGNSEIVHHVLVYQDTTSNTDDLDNADPLPGYTNFGGTGSANSTLIAPYVPGSEPIIFPRGTGVKMYKNARIILQIHYPEGSEGQLDSTTCLIRFATQSSVREVYISPVLSHGNITNGPLVIPKDQVKTFYQSVNIPIDVSLLSIMPHMHLIGKSTKVFVKPATGDTIPLIKINDWDFHWQGQYRFQYLQKITSGSKIQSIVSYDNTVNNPNNPNIPPKDVSSGEATTSEMMITFVYYMQYKAGDETILQDSSLIPARVYQPKAIKLIGFKNPVHDQLNLGIAEEEAEIQICDELGRLVLSKSYTHDDRIEKSLELMNINVSKLKAGNYFLTLTTQKSAKVYYAKFIKE